MKFYEMQHLVSHCSYKPGWGVELKLDGDRPYLQVVVDERSDTTLDPRGKTQERTPWKGGKKYLSFHMCRQEIVGAVLGAIKDAEMHEVHEWFRYKGASIYNPHLDPDVLAGVAKKASSFNVRENAMDPK